MSTLELDKIGTKYKDRLNLYVPIGMKEQLEELRKVMRSKSVNALVVELFKEHFIAEGI